MKNFLILLLVFFSFVVHAEVKVAFLEIKRPDGRLLQLETNGRFSHVAISYHGKWLHSDPTSGVTILSTKELERIGTVKEILVLEEVGELSSEKVNSLVGKPYDRNFNWKDETSFYCSELVAKILGVQPEPMAFASPLWPAKYKVLRGSLGLSPDDLHRILKKKIRAKTCAKTLGPS